MSWNLAFSGHNDKLTDAERQAEAIEVRRLGREFMEKLRKHDLDYAQFSGFDGSKNLLVEEGQ